MGLEPAENGHQSVEIEESLVIGNLDANIWIFGIINIATKEVIVIYVSNRRNQALFPIIKQNINTIIGPNGNRELLIRIY